MAAGGDDVGNQACCERDSEKEEGRQVSRGKRTGNRKRQVN